MKKLQHILLATIICLLCWKSTKAEVKLPAIISSNMVLQRNSTVALWGWADAKEKITIKVSWIEELLGIRADKNGHWKINVPTTNTRAAQQIVLKSESSSITLENVLFGEVWLCSGQSNMQQPVRGFNGQPTFGATEVIAKANNPNIRLFTVGKVGAKEPQDDLSAYKPWQEASPESVAGFSAVAYFFGQQLQEILDVPVGLIHSSWGASAVETWMSRESLQVHQEIELTDTDVVKQGNKVPTALFNAMINPLIPYTINGMLWYQGEANRSEPDNYKLLFPSMIKDWRSRWGMGDFPVYFTQIAPFPYGNQEAFQGPENTAFMREAQLACVDLIPNSGIAITLDAGDSVSIHPPKKKEVADRLLYNALNQTYGFKAVDGKSPQVDSVLVKSGKIVLKFKYAETGLYAFGNLEGFEIAGEDKVFYPAEAKIVKHTKNIVVLSERVTAPVAVRYAWRNWVIGTLYDTNMLPASSFRTDNWKNATRAKE